MKRKKGFTLLEVILAITILTMAVGGAFILIQQTLVGSSLSQSKLTAAYLAQEGVEIVRNIRDSNWLKAISWTAGLDNGDWEADYNDSALDYYYSTGRYLYINGVDGFYCYLDTPDEGDIQTKFKRKITLQETADDTLEVQVEVNWEERGRAHNFKVINYLYNWYGD